MAGTAEPRNAATVTLAGETLHPASDATLHWPDMDTLFIADPHFGKAATFRSHGIPVPEQASFDLLRLQRALDETGARTLVILGDLFHARAGVTAEVQDALQRWRDEHRSLTITLIRGNHDRSAGDPTSTLGMDIHDGPMQMGPFALCHEPRHCNSGYALAGHLHPAVMLEDARTRARFRCFHFGADIGVLPAFGSFTGAKVVQPALGDRVFVLVEGQIAQVSGSTPALQAEDAGS
ncbi:MAG: ligase-associated DNA damage response endonuclease PdeM [Planctomycetota bacterium]